MKSACLLVYANKQDLKAALSSAEISDALALTSLRKTIQWHIQPCCALTGEGYRGARSVRLAQRYAGMA